MGGLTAGLLDNRTILEKADLALADLTTGGGLLAPAQAQKFMRILINEAVILKQATVVPMPIKTESLGSTGSGRTPNRLADEGGTLSGPCLRWRG